MARYLQLIAATFILLISPLAHAEKEKSEIQKQAEAAYGEWLKAVSSRDIKVIDALYTKDAEVMTSLNNGLLKDRAEITARLERLVKVPNIEVTTKKKMFDLYNGNTPIISGICTFIYTNTKTGKTDRMPVRFSMIFEKNKDGKLLISKQHTSDMPL